ADDLAVLLALLERLDLVTDDPADQVAQGDRPAVAQLGREGDGKVGEQGLLSTQGLAGDGEHGSYLRRRETCQMGRIVTRRPRVRQGRSHGRFSRDAKRSVVALRFASRL